MFIGISGNLQIFAASEAIGIISGNEYYIKNIDSNKYLSVQGSGSSSGTNVRTESYSGKSNQKWRVTKQSNGYYLLSPACATNAYLDVNGNYNQSGSNVDIWIASPSGTYVQWQIVRSSVVTSEGSYYLTSRCSNDSMYLHENNSTSNVEQYSSKSSYAIWSFERVTKSDADIISTDDANTRSGNDSIFVSCTNNMGYNGGDYPNTPASTALSWLKYDSIFVHNGHGNKGFMTFYDGSANSRINALDISSLPSNELAGLRCLITTGCYTAASGSSGNIIANLYNRGAQFAYGWTIAVDITKGSNWVKCFFERADDNVTVKKCIEHADYWSYAGESYYRGDIYQILSR